METTIHASSLTEEDTISATLYRDSSFGYSLIDGQGIGGDDILLPYLFSFTSLGLVLPCRHVSEINMIDSVRLLSGK